MKNLILFNTLFKRQDNNEIELYKIFFSFIFRIFISIN
jgi:hypothetical protein